MRNPKQPRVTRDSRDRQDADGLKSTSFGPSACAFPHKPFSFGASNSGAESQDDLRMAKEADELIAMLSRKRGSEALVQFLKHFPEGKPLALRYARLIHAVDVAWQQPYECQDLDDLTSFALNACSNINEFLFDAAKRRDPHGVDMLARLAIRATELLAEIARDPKDRRLLSQVAAERHSWPVLKSTVKGHDENHAAILNALPMGVATGRCLSAKQRHQPRDKAYQVAVQFLHYLESHLVFSAPSKEVADSPVWVRDLVTMLQSGSYDTNTVSEIVPFAPFSHSNWPTLKNIAIAALDEALPASEFAKGFEDPNAFAEWKALYPLSNLHEQTPGRWRNAIKKTILARLDTRFRA